MSEKAWGSSSNSAFSETEISNSGPYHPLPTSEEVGPFKAREDEEEKDEDSPEDQSPVEEVALTVPTTDDRSLPLWTFRMWTLGIASCALLSFLNMFFSYRTEPLVISAVSAQVAVLPIGHILAKVLPSNLVRVPWTGFEFSMNPGPFNMKEHVLITIFANAGTSFGSGNSYGIYVVNIIKAFYKKEIAFAACLFLIITSQVLGYGWAGLLRKYLVEPAHMWWPSNLVQVSVFRTLHEKEESRGRLSRSQFFLIAMTVSFAYYVLPGYLFPMVTYLSWVCWVWPHSVTAQQIGSGLHGLGVGAVSLDWSGVAAYLRSPLVTPWFSIVNLAVGTVIFLYVFVPAAYWMDAYDAKKFPIYSSKLFTGDGQEYNITRIVDQNFKLDVDAYESYSKLHISTLFALSYGFGFARIAATVSHVVLFHGKEIWHRSRAALNVDHPDVHTRLMRFYPDVPDHWFLLLLGGSVLLTTAACLRFQEQFQLPWWGVLLACALSSTLTLPLGVLTATTNLTPGLNIISEYIMGLLLPGQPIANVLFKTYGFNSTQQAIAFLSDFKLGHYMKIPPRSMFIVQLVGAVVNGTLNLVVAWWMLSSIPNICDLNMLPADSPWTCPSDRVFFDASVIWGLIGPGRIFGSMGLYRNLNWFFLGGALLPIPVWALSRVYPEARWIALINVPVLLTGGGEMPPAAAVNITSWVIVGAIFNYYIFRHHKAWWKRYNYVLSAAMDAGTAFMAVLLYLCLGLSNKSIDWWGTQVDHCPLATCPTAPGIIVKGCPVC